MNHWWNQNVPNFVVVGRVNAGKTSVLATLLENDDPKAMRISSTPGETIQIQAFPVSYNDEELVCFLDTPGFQQPVEAMQVIRELAGDREPTPETIKTFVEQCADRFPDEATLLQPVVKGAGILYVVDISKPLRDEFRAEMEILRWTGRPRLALLNPQSSDDTYREAWQQQLGTAFNLTRTFDAHAARYPERQKLMQALLQIEEAHAPQIEKLIEFMTTEWDRRREEAAEHLLEFLHDALTLRVSKGITENTKSLPVKRDRVVQELTEGYYKKLAKLENTCLEHWLKLYRHHLIDTEIDPLRYPGLDLTVLETWKKYGLTKWQLALFGAIVGAAVGVAGDALLGGITMGVLAALGALTGGTLAYLKAEKLPELKMGQIKFEDGSGTTLVVGAPKNLNFPWVLLDSMLPRYFAIISRPHAIREQAKLKTNGEPVARNLPQSTRNTLGKWFASCMKGKPNPEKAQESLTLLLEIMIPSYE